MKNLNLSILSESLSFSENEGGSNRVVATLARGGMVNRNYRFYPVNVLAEACSSAQDDVQAGKLIGLSDHPGWLDDPKGSPSDTVIKWDKLYMSGDDLMGEGVILNTSKGRDIMAMHEAGVHLSVSTNGYAAYHWVEAKELPVSTDLKSDELVAHVDKLELLTIDVVNNPSNVHAHVHKEAVALREAVMKERNMEEKEKKQEVMVEKDLREVIQVKEQEITALKEQVAKLEAEAASNKLQTMIRNVAETHGVMSEGLRESALLVAEAAETFEEAEKRVKQLFTSIPNHGNAGVPAGEEVVKEKEARESIRGVIQGVLN